MGSEVSEEEDLAVAKEGSGEAGLEEDSEVVVASTLPLMLESAPDSELSSVLNLEDLLVQALVEALEVSLAPKLDRVVLAAGEFTKKKPKPDKPQQEPKMICVPIYLHCFEKFGSY